jgi:hypothetical protein
VKAKGRAVARETNSVGRPVGRRVGRQASVAWSHNVEESTKLPGGARPSRRFAKRNRPYAGSGSIVCPPSSLRSAESLGSCMPITACRPQRAIGASGSRHPRSWDVSGLSRKRPMRLSVPAIIAASHPMRDATALTLDSPRRLDHGPANSRGRGRGIASGAEGATAPETLRQKDRASHDTLESSRLSMKRLADGARGGGLEPTS